jgi:RNA polymerase sigma-70 factor (ECF subfamily)
VKDRANISGSEPARHPSATPPSLLDGLRHRNPESWRRLAALYGPLVYGWCRKVGLQAADAEDVVQDVFLVVLGRVVDFRRDPAGGTFRGWLLSITRNKLGDWLRRRKAEAPAPGGSDAARRLAALPDFVEREQDPDDGRADSLCRRALELIRHEFAVRSWQAFWRVTVGGSDVATVADELGLTRNAVYIAKARILHRLREVLGEL